MNTDKAYLLGLVVGGGDFGNAEDVFRIKLPYKKWGSYLDNPKRGGAIAKDILKKVGPMFRTIYGLTVQYDTSDSGNWIILCEGDTSTLRDDLEQHGISPEGEIRGKADISQLVSKLLDDNLKRRFIAGLADTIGSMAKSQRRFTEEHQIISFEIKGYNFQFVCDLCRLLYSINCIPDQINWNHPNIHCTSDPYYKQWNKGFKLRILLDQYASFGAFAFRTKAESLKENRQLQNETHVANKCEEREIHATPSTVHPAENDGRLPDAIRGGHYVHFCHFCSVLGCEHAPNDKVQQLLADVGELINPFPILCKDIESGIRERIQSDSLLSSRKYTTIKIRVASLMNEYKTDRKALLYGNGANSGYPIAEVLKGIAYVIAAPNELRGKRTKAYKELIEKRINEDADFCVEIGIPDMLTPLTIFANGRGVLVGAKNPDVYANLVSRDANNSYKIFVRKITEEDLKNG